MRGGRGRGSSRGERRLVVSARGETLIVHWEWGWRSTSSSHPTAVSRGYASRARYALFSLSLVLLSIARSLSIRFFPSSLPPAIVFLGPRDVSLAASFADARAIARWTISRRVAVFRAKTWSPLIRILRGHFVRRESQGRDVERRRRAKWEILRNVLMPLETTRHDLD